MPSLPVFHVLFPSVSHQQAVRDGPIRDMGYDRGSRANAGYFIKDVAGPNESLVAGQSPGADVIKGQEAGHAQWLVVVQPATIIVAATELGLQPDLSYRNVTAQKPMLNLHQLAGSHHDATTSPIPDLTFAESGVGDGIKA